MEGPYKHGDIVDKICELCGINSRRRSGAPTLSKKEAIQILSCIRTYHRLVAETKGQARDA
jgi:hypothetical protein